VAEIRHANAHRGGLFRLPYGGPLEDIATAVTLAGGPRHIRRMDAMNADTAPLAAALSDRYLLEREVGVGGSATVYLARDLRNRRQVALKVLHRDLARAFGPERFQREIETTANLRHPNILPLFDSGEVDGTLYYVMPYVSGESLRAQMDRAGPLRIDEAVRLVREIADALGHAHDRGLVHRDVKPENVLIEHGRAIVADFGIARALAGTGAERLTNTGMSLGTPLYMSPEQALGDAAVDPRSDQYSLGCMFYEMLAGQPPFTGANPMAVIVKHLQHPVPPIHARRPDVPAPMAAAIERALSKDPGDRFGSVGEWAAALTSPAHAGVTAPAAATVNATAHAEERLGITVIPFVTTTTDDMLVGMAGELADSIGSGLSVFPYLTVVRGEDARAEYLLTGSLRRAGPTLRVTVQVVHRTSKAQLWGDSFNRTLSDAGAFAVIDDIADHVIAVVADPYGVLVRRFTAAASAKSPESLTPYEAVLLYYHYHQRPAPDTHLRARQELERASQREPRNADVWACLTYLYLDEERHAFNPRGDALARALAAARRATDAGPTNANAHHALAEAHYFRGDPGGFRASAERAVALNRRDGATAAMLGNLLAASGDYARGVELAQHAIACNPYHPGWYLFGTFFEQYRRGAFADALATAERVDMPMYFVATLVLAVAHAELGNTRQADAACTELRALMPTIERDGPVLMSKWLRYNPELLDAFLAGMTRAGIIATPDRSGGETAQLHSIAVLPFTNMSNDADADFLGDGFAEDILSELARLSGLRVIARASSFALKGQRSDMRSIGTALGAQYVLDGSIRKAGARFRITVQLVDAAAGHTLWSERYDRDMTDVFAVQDEITVAVRDALSARLLGIAVPAKRAAPPIDPATYELYLRGKHLIARRLESAERGLEIMEEVTRRAPRYAPALQQLATAHKMRVMYGAVAPADGWPLVLKLCERAVEADPGYGPAHFTLGDAAFYWEWNWPKAESLFSRAVTLDPNEPDVLASYAMFKCSTHDFGSGLGLAERAVSLDPLNPTVHLRAAIVQYLARRHDLVFATCERMKELAPDFAEGYRWKGLSLLALRRADEAVAEIERAVPLSGRNVWAVFDLGLALAACGRTPAARDVATELEERGRTEPFSNYVHTLGAQLEDPPDMDRVFTLLEEAVRVQRSFWLVMFDVEPTLDWLRDDPRFTALLRSVGIPRLQGT
jgi:TolB-like protein/cytochrome c-type biogenesis protein CcmH/NrfG